MRHTLVTDSIDDTAAILRAGGLVAFPTETVYGLGARALDADAVRRVFTAKERPADNPLIVHIAASRDVGLVAAEVPAGARRLIDAFFPGPLTLVLPKRPHVPAEVTAGLESVAIRMPAHRLARALIAATGEPLVAPSANRSGRPSPTTWQAVRDDLEGRIDAILRGAPTRIGLESTVVDASGEAPIVLRLGAVTLEDLQAIEPATRLSIDGPDVPAASPGLRHRHYAPEARVVIVEDPAGVAAAADAAFIGLEAPAGDFARTEVCPDEAAYAHRLYAFFRRCDASGVRTIYAQAVPERGLGRAIMDRLHRAADH